MLNKFLVVVAIIFVSPSVVLADDIFFAFGQGSDAASDSTITADAGTGSAFIFSDVDFEFDAAALRFTNSNPNVIQFTGGEAFNPNLVLNGAPLGLRFNNPVTLELDGTNPETMGDLTFVAVQGAFGVGPNTQGIDPGFQPDAGDRGGFLLARVDYNITGVGTADLGLSLGENGIVRLDVNGAGIDTVVLSPTLGSATLTVGPASVIPEPSSLGLITLVAFGLAARRRKS